MTDLPLTDPTGWGARYLAGESLRSIGQSEGISHVRVWRYLDAIGVAFRPKGRQRVLPANPNLSWAERYAAGEGLWSIAHSAGVSAGKVRRHVLAAGVAIRPRGHARRIAAAEASARAHTDERSASA